MQFGEKLHNRCNDKTNLPLHCFKQLPQVEFSPIHFFHSIASALPLDLTDQHVFNVTWYYKCSSLPSNALVTSESQVLDQVCFAINHLFAALDQKTDFLNINL